MQTINASACLPHDLEDALLVGRVWRPAPVDGPCVVVVRNGVVFDITAHVATVADLLDRPDVLQFARDVDGEQLGSAEELIGAALAGDVKGVRLLAPCDVQAIKACGVTFAVSLLERVIEEQAGGNPARANALRAELLSTIGGDLSSIKPARRRQSSSSANSRRAAHGRNTWKWASAPSPKSSRNPSPCRQSASAPMSACTLPRSGTIRSRRSCWQ